MTPLLVSEHCVFIEPGEVLRRGAGRPWGAACKRLAPSPLQIQCKMVAICIALCLCSSLVFMLYLLLLILNLNLFE